MMKGNALGSRFASATSARPAAEILSQDAFWRIVDAERERMERSRRGLVLMVLECGAIALKTRRDQVLNIVQTTLVDATRETDKKGWYEEGLSLAVLFTEIVPSEGLANARVLADKIRKALSDVLNSEELCLIQFSYRIFPGNKRISDPHPSDSNLQTAQARLKAHAGPTGISLLAKRGMDILGSSCALLLGAPFLLGVAIAIKLTSEGPVLFRQTRHGQGGAAFTFLKFRSMHVRNDPAIHREYVKKLIAGQQDGKSTSGSSAQVFKLTNDPRITSVGGWLRRTSMDELPQFVNVLKGDMSLVGPRPPVTYELEHYEPWHHRRLDVKPGLTGLWQVKGRSRTTFDEMVRMDLDYVQNWSLWLDVKILLRTPVVVLMGDGAY